MVSCLGNISNQGDMVTGLVIAFFSFGVTALFALFPLLNQTVELWVKYLYGFSGTGGIILGFATEVLRRQLKVSVRYSTDMVKERIHSNINKFDYSGGSTKTKLLQEEEIVEKLAHQLEGELHRLLGQRATVPRPVVKQLLEEYKNKRKPRN